MGDMDAMRSVQGEKGLLRWGGLAGILGGVLLTFVFVFVGAVVGPDPAGPEGPVSRFPQIAAARTLENSLYLVVMALWTVQVVALSRALSAAGGGAARVGGALGVAGLAVLAAGAMPHVVATRLSDLYHAAGASAADQATIAIVWQANLGLFDALMVVGLALLPMGLVALGMAMRREPAFGRGFGAVTVLLGLIGVGAASAFVLEPRVPTVFIGFLALIVLTVVVGVKSVRLSRAARPAPAGRELRVAESSLSS
jgi:hypothetical protein